MYPVCFTQITDNVGHSPSVLYIVYLNMLFQNSEWACESEGEHSETASSSSFAVAAANSHIYWGYNALLPLCWTLMPCPRISSCESTIPAEKLPCEMYAETAAWEKVDTFFRKSLEKKLFEPRDWHWFHLYHNNILSTYSQCFCPLRIVSEVHLSVS